MHRVIVAFVAMSILQGIAAFAGESESGAEKKDPVL